MANKADDPDLAAGRAILSGGAAASSPSAPVTDPDIAAGRTVLTAPAALATATDAAPAAPDWTVRGVVRNVAAAGPRIGADFVNILSDPFANLIGRPLLTAGQTAYDFAAPFLGYDRLTDAQRNALYEDFGAQPGTRAVQAVGNALGADPYNVPGTPLERRIGTATEGAGTAAAFGGPVAAIPGAAGATTGDIAAENVPPWLAPSANLLGNIVGAKLGNITTGVGSRAYGAATGAKTPVAAAYDELGIDKSLIGDVSGDPTARLLQAYGSKSPFGASVVSPVEQKVVGQFNQAVEDTASRLGTSTSEQAAGEALQREARDWKDVVFPQRQAAAWAPVDQLLGNESVEPTNYRSVLTSLTNKLAALPETAKALIPAKTWQLLDAINQDVPAGEAMSWPQAQALRSTIGQVMGVPEIVQSIGKNQLKAAYAGISQDMQDTAAAVDARNAAAQSGAPSAVDAFNNANKVSTDGHAFIEGPLSKIIKSNNPAQDKDPELATRSVLGSTDTTLQEIRREMPQAANELAAYKLRDMALATPGAAGRTGQETSVGSFLTDLNRMRQQMPGGFQALYSDPAVARRIDALATVADTMKETAKRANVSGTGPYLALGETGATATAAWLATHSPAATAAAVSLPFALNRGAAYAATSPLLARMAGVPPADVPNALTTGLITSGNRLNNPLLRP